MVGDGGGRVLAEYASGAESRWSAFQAFCELRDEPYLPADPTIRAFIDDRVKVDKKAGDHQALCGDDRARAHRRRAIESLLKLGRGAARRSVGYAVRAITA